MNLEVGSVTRSPGMTQGASPQNSPASIMSPEQQEAAPRSGVAVAHPLPPHCSQPASQHLMHRFPWAKQRTGGGRTFWL